MIVDIPSPEEFRENGIAFLNLAWEATIKVSMEFAQADDENWLPENGDERRQIEDNFWKQAQHGLSVAIALAQQGTEFLLKGKIAAVSPFLLIADEPNRWPSGCDRADQSFADFKTIDARELIKLHDTVCGSRLPEPFKIEFERLRKLRNAVMHSIDSRSSFSAKEVALSILEIAEFLEGPFSWPRIRSECFKARFNVLEMYSMDSDVLLAMEILHIVDDLGFQAAEITRFYEFNKRQRRYLCPNCRENSMDFQANLAQLRPNTPVSTNVYCISCRENYAVIRQPCSEENCRGNVIEEVDGQCLTCGELNNIELNDGD